MNRQQAPEPVVRPLKKIAVNEVVPLLKQAPQNKIYFVIRNFVNNKDAVGSLWVTNDSKLDLTIIACNFPSNDYIIMVDPSGISEASVIADLPCYSQATYRADTSMAGTTAIRTLCEGTDISKGNYSVELKDNGHNEKSIEYVFEL